MTARRGEHAVLDAVVAAMAEHGWEASSPSVLAKKPMRFGGRKQSLYVVEAATPDGPRYGAGGPFTMVLGLTPASIERIPAAKRLRRLANVAVGTWLVQRAPVATWSAAQVAKAFAARSSSYLVLPSHVEEGGLPGGALSTSLSTSRMKPVTPDVVGVWIEEHAYAVTDVRMRVKLSRSDVVHVVGPHWLRWNRAGELLAFRPADARSVTFPEVAVEHVVGTVFGPCEVLNKWGTATLVD